MSRRNRNRRTRPVSTLTENRWNDANLKQVVSTPPDCPDYVAVYRTPVYDSFFR